MTALHQPIQSGFARITDALGDPAREAIVSALADGKAMPAGELAAVAAISPQSASRICRSLSMPGCCRCGRRAGSDITGSRTTTLHR
jgi:hypothetical protein